VSRNLTDERTIGRLLTLTDGIFAIAILFLLIDIKVPEDIDTIGIASALFSLWLNYLAFFISFVVIGLYWSAHVRLFREIIRFDWMLVAFNFLYLLLIVLIPFASQVLASNSNTTAIIMYSLVIACAGYVNTGMRIYSSHEHRLIERAQNNRSSRQSIFLSLVAPVGFTVSIGIAFLNTIMAQIMWRVILITHLVVQNYQKLSEE
jgi:uncharacterized membrane protein